MKSAAPVGCFSRPSSSGASIAVGSFLSRRQQARETSVRTNVRTHSRPHPLPELFCVISAARPSARGSFGLANTPLVGSWLRWLVAWSMRPHSDVIQFVSLMAERIGFFGCKMENGKGARFPYHCQAFHRRFVRGRGSVLILFLVVPRVFSISSWKVLSFWPENIKRLLRDGLQRTRQRQTISQFRPSVCSYGAKCIAFHINKSSFIDRRFPRPTISLRRSVPCTSFALAATPLLRTHPERAPKLRSVIRSFPLSLNQRGDVNGRNFQVWILFSTKSGCRSFSKMP